MRKNISGGSPYEPIIGFSRAVRTGSYVHVSGTGPVGADTADAAAQTERIFEIIQGALEQAGSSLEQVVRTRLYLTHVEDWEAVAAIHGRLFGAIRPAATIVVVAKLLHPSWRIEIEADAALPESEAALPKDPMEITRERIRQIEEKHSRKLRNPPPQAG